MHGGVQQPLLLGGLKVWFLRARAWDRIGAEAAAQNEEGLRRAMSLAAQDADPAQSVPGLVRVCGGQLPEGSQRARPRPRAHRHRRQFTAGEALLCPTSEQHAHISWRGMRFLAACAASAATEIVQHQHRVRVVEEAPTERPHLKR
jgi:hypothetical protein